ncbi:hypothetical protein REPUB_Repub19eG0136600 [Reevesia pubescens]
MAQMSSHSNPNNTFKEEIENDGSEMASLTYFYILVAVVIGEYGYMMKITEKSDVYTYGVVMLEVLIGKQTIDPTIPDGLHIVDWVRQKRGRIEVLDHSLQARPKTKIDEMLQTLGVAFLCVNPSPDDRPTMKDVAAMVKEIKQEMEE